VACRDTIESAEHLPGVSRRPKALTLDHPSRVGFVGDGAMWVRYVVQAGCQRKPPSCESCRPRGKLLVIGSGCPLNLQPTRVFA